MPPRNGGVNGVSHIVSECSQRELQSDPLEELAVFAISNVARSDPPEDVAVSCEAIH